MNNKIIGTIAFLVGAGVGVGGTYKFFKTKYEGYAEEEIESVKNMVRNRDLKKTVASQDVDTHETGENDHGILIGDNIITGTLGKKVVEEKSQAEKDFDKGIARGKAAFERRIKNREVVNYNEIASKYVKDNEITTSFSKQNDEDVDPEDNEENNAPSKDVQFPQEPYVITAKSFVDDFANNEKITLTYYAVDEILLDEDETPISDGFERVIGTKALDSFGLMDNEENVVYVRNEKYNIDYEIIKLEESYSGE